MACHTAPCCYPIAQRGVRRDKHSRALVDHFCCNEFDHCWSIACRLEAGGALVAEAATRSADRARRCVGTGAPGGGGQCWPLRTDIVVARYRSSLRPIGFGSVAALADCRVRVLSCRCAVHDIRHRTASAAARRVVGWSYHRVRLGRGVGTARSVSVARSTVRCVRCCRCGVRGSALAVSFGARAAGWSYGGVRARHPWSALAARGTGSHARLHSHARGCAVSSPRSSWATSPPWSYRSVRCDVPRVCCVQAVSQSLRPIGDQTRWPLPRRAWCAGRTGRARAG